MAGRGHAFERLEHVSGTVNPIDKRPSVLGNPILPTVYAINGGDGMLERHSSGRGGRGAAAVIVS